jgi:hypothetical protein
MGVVLCVVAVCQVALWSAQSIGIFLGENREFKQPLGLRARLQTSCTKPKGWSRAIAQLGQNSRYSEMRDYLPRESVDGNAVTSARADDTETHIILLDLYRVIRPDASQTLGAGEILGEVSALTRTPRSSPIRTCNYWKFVCGVNWLAELRAPAVRSF